MKYYISLLLLFICNRAILAQIEMSIDGKYRVFRSLKETEGINPDSVQFLDLGNNGLKSFPKEVLKFKNLIALDFENKDNDYYFNFRPSMLSERERKKIKNTTPKSHRTLEVDGHKKNKNRFSEIPNEIATLNKLEELIIGNKTYTNGNSFQGSNMYISIQQTIVVNPDSVSYLDLNNSGLDTFPMEILKFKNLSYLFLSNNKTTFYFYIKSKRDGNNPNNTTSTYYWEVKNKKNTFKEIPPEIASLTKLEVLMIAKKYHTKRLKSYLPGCDFFTH